MCTLILNDNLVVYELDLLLLIIMITTAERGEEREYDVDRRWRWHTIVRGCNIVELLALARQP